jgi:hypothetical protein
MNRKEQPRPPLSRMESAERGSEHRYAPWDRIMSIAIEVIISNTLYLIPRIPFQRKRVVWAVLMGGCQSYVST